MKVVDCVSAERYDVSGTKCEKGRAVPKKKKDLIIRAKKEIIRYKPFPKRGLKDLDNNEWTTNARHLQSKGGERAREDRPSRSIIR